MINAAIDYIWVTMKTLFIENNPVDLITLTRKIQQITLPYNYQITDFLTAKSILAFQSFDVVILAYQGENATFVQLFDLLKAKNYPLIILAESGQEEK